ncbi:hypothetical protein PHSY_002497 [Pseudozyma hubeiensis SY62]|uniref:Uncharacterized protein n=1 Tax=Pseudozyma hubeiensis (strain SY62) TaxID=1305764 RepID=R9P194_PSEHS|nr:hypothetical protein PHSY_002497 [Pseudozyma hubeiensis SY62]GAC94924.1 hypothetical protein PHSY_002497 [Pseudozyma hubeiensis SY62]
MTIDIDRSLRDDAQETKVLGQLLFTFSDDELDHDPKQYLELQTPHRERPKKHVWKQLSSLRPELEALSTCSSSEQLLHVRSSLAQRGFAALPHHSRVLAEQGIDTQPSYTAFIEENLALIRDITGADHVILWNTAKRDSTVSVSASLSDDHQRQRQPQGIESRFDKPLEPPALFAHIDQDPTYGTKVCSMAIAGTPSLLEQSTCLDPFEAMDKDLAKNYSRTMIINLWRPVGGTVYQKPLAVADYRSLDKASLSRHANPFGCGYDIHAHPDQTWHFIPHQTNDEVLVFKCYDSLSLQQQQLQGPRSGAEALYGAHCAVSNLKGDYPTPPLDAPPRKSVEFRFVAVWR